MTTPAHERTFESDEKLKLPRSYIMRRMHSLLGVWLVIYLCQHLLVNSQAALFFKDDGYGFVAAVNQLEALPYLRVIEIVLLGLPFLIHGIWGMYYAWTGKLNAHRTDGTRPALPQYRRNRAYSWQRITSWLLVVGILAHVIQMRFVDYPTHATRGDMQSFMVRVTYDRGLPLVAEKLQAKLYTQEQIVEKQEALQREEAALGEKIDNYAQRDAVEEEKEWLAAAGKKTLKQDEVLAVTPSAGGAFFLIVRETFKSPWMVVLYSLLVVAATFHAFNGLWTALITWGITLTRRSQKVMRTITNGLMAVVTFLGLMAAWGTYWTFQFQG